MAAHPVGPARPSLDGIIVARAVSAWAVPPLRDPRRAGARGNPRRAGAWGIRLLRPRPADLGGRVPAGPRAAVAIPGTGSGLGRPACRLGRPCAGPGDPGPAADH